MSRIRIFFVIFVLLVAFLLCFSLSVSADADSLISSKYENNAEAIYLYSYDSKSVLYCVGEDKILKPASTAKIMMGLIACEKLESRFDEKILITKDMLKDHVGTTMGLKEGMTVSVEDLLYGAICGCNNDATQVVAIVCSGTVENFVSEMNERAARLNMRSTVYANPTGLDEPIAQTTISDVALLSYKAAKNDLYMKISSAKSKTVLLGDEQTVVYNRNALISHFTSDKYLNSNISGLNAGSTDEGGYVVSAIANVGGCKYLCIVLGAEAENGEIYSYKILNELVNGVNKKYVKTQLFEKGEVLSELDVRFALNTKNETKLRCILEDDLYVYLPQNADVKENLKYSVFLHDDLIDAPVEKGAIVGGVNVYYKGQMIASGVLVSHDAIEENSFLVFMSSMKDFLLSRYFFVFFGFAVVGILIFFCFDRRYRLRKRVGYVQYKNFF